jgi:hypothetical protein
LKLYAFIFTCGEDARNASPDQACYRLKCQEVRAKYRDDCEFLGPVIIHLNIGDCLPGNWGPQR